MQQAAGQGAVPWLWGPGPGPEAGPAGSPSPPQGLTSTSLGPAPLHLHRDRDREKEKDRERELVRGLPVSPFEPTPCPPTTNNTTNNTTSNTATNATAARTFSLPSDEGTEEEEGDEEQQEEDKEEEEEALLDELDGDLIFAWAPDRDPQAAPHAANTGVGRLLPKSNLLLTTMRSSFAGREQTASTQQSGRVRSSYQFIMQLLMPLLYA